MLGVLTLGDGRGVFEPPFVEHSAGELSDLGHHSVLDIQEVGLESPIDHSLE